MPRPTAIGRSPWAAIASTVAIVVALSAAGYAYYRLAERSVRARQFEMLAAIGTLKASQVEAWRARLLVDVRRVSTSPLLRRAITAVIRAPGDPVHRRALDEMLALERNAGEYSDVLVLRPDGRTVLLSAARAAGPLDSATERAVAVALRTGEAALSDFFRNTDGDVDVDAVAALRDSAGVTTAIAVVRSSAAAHLYPLIQSWPTPSPSAETLLLRRDGDSVLFLSELRHRPHSALSLRMPVSPALAPLVNAVREARGAIEGLDYRGIPVLADLGPIEGSPWFLVAKMDRREALGELRYRRGEVITIVALLVLLTMGAVLYRRRQAALFENVRESERGLREAQVVGRVGSYVLDVPVDRWTSSATLDAVFGIDAAYPRTTAGWLRIVHPDDRDAMALYFSTLLKERRNFDREYRIVRPGDGVERWVWGLGEVTFDAGGTPQRMVGSIQDITGRKLDADRILRLNAELEERVQRRTEELSVANKELEAFAYSVSHDLRAPLRAIDGYARILEEEQHARIDDEGRRALGIVRNEARRMGRLIDDLLAFSRLGRKDVQKRPIDMTALAQEVFEELGRGMPACDATVRVGELPPVAGDPGLVRQVWANLLGNAIKFSRGCDPATIEVTGSIQGNQAVYVVRDSGVGFDMRYADKLFGVFQRLHGPEEFEGTGVGLALVQRIVTRHGGRVWAEGELNRGARFSFSLPVGSGSAA